MASRSDRRVRASAQATITLRVECGSAWGPNCTVEQVLDQAAEDALGAVRRMIDASKEPIQIVGQPAITMVLAEEKR